MVSNNNITLPRQDDVHASYLFDYLQTYLSRFGEGRSMYQGSYSIELKKSLESFIEEHMQDFVKAIDVKHEVEHYGHVFYFRSRDNENLFKFTKVGNKYSGITFVGRTDLRDALEAFLKKNIKKEQATTAKGSVYYLVMTPSDGPELRQAPSLLKFDLVEENYSTKVREQHKIVLDQIADPKPRGKLSIYQGPPGTGKTYLIRHLISSLKDCYVILLQPSMVSALADPNFLSALMETAVKKLPIVFILEDADEVLAKREAANIAGISTLLNLGDGILGSLLDTRVVCSTNAKIKEFDEAVMRPGRLLQFIEVGNLTPDEALAAGLNILGRDVLLALAGKGIEPDDFTSCKTIAEVYAQANKYKDMLS